MIIHCGTQESKIVFFKLYDEINDEIVFFKCKRIYVDSDGSYVGGKLKIIEIFSLGE